MSRLRFAHRYRPTRFVEVRGQEHPVAVLSALAAREAGGERKYAGEHLFLHGSVGSGKTSLVRIYERALNCLNLREGSPCDVCESCRIVDREQVGLREYDTAGTGGDRDDFDRWFHTNYRTPVGYKWQVLFFDEAHRLTTTASDRLLKSVEDTIGGVVFCFATTEYEKVRPALRSRLFQLEIRPLSALDSIGLLRDVAEAEHIAYEAEGLALLAGVIGGQPRDLITALEVAAGGGKTLTEDFISEHLAVDHKASILACVEALVSNDLSRALMAFDAWRKPASEKIKWLSAFFLSLYHNQICGMKIIIDPVIHSIRAERNTIISAFMLKFGVERVGDLAPYWLNILEFWDVEPVTDESLALLRLTRLHDLINHQLTKNPVALPSSVDHHVTRASPVPMAREDAAAVSLSKANREYLTPDDVRLIINTASYFVQEYGVLFNAAYIFTPSQKRQKDENLARLRIEEFLQSLEQEWRADNFSHISVFERYESDVRCLVVAHIPTLSQKYRRGETAKHKEWVSSWSEELEFIPSNKPNDWAYHRNHVLSLCAGLSEEAVWKTGDRPLLDLVGISKIRRRRRVGPVRGNLVLTSVSIAQSRIEDDRKRGLAPLSPFDDGAWDRICGKWELLEHEDRKSHKEMLSDEIKKIERQYPTGSDNARVEVEGFMRALDLDARSRQRSWVIWPK